MWKIQQAMQDDAIRAVHTAFIPVRDSLSNFSARLEKPRSREPSQPALSYEHIENFTKDLEVRRDLGNRAHVKRPLKQNKIYNWSTQQPVPVPQAYKIHQIILSRIEDSFKIPLIQYELLNDIPLSSERSKRNTPANNN